MRFNYYLFFLIAGLIVFRLCTVSYSYSDEVVYTMDGRLYSNGATPYVDFFLAHPPLILLLNKFTTDLLSLRIALLVVQVLLVIVMNEILKLKNVEEPRKSLINLLFVISPAFIHIFNLNMGFETTTLFLMLSYYFHLRNDKWGSLIMAGLAVMTRLFSIFYIIAMVLITWREKKLFYLLALLPLVLMIIIQPLTLEQVFSYHVGSGKGIHGVQRYNTISIFLVAYAIFILLLFVSHDYETLLIGLFIFFGTMTMKTVYFMYTSLTGAWIILSSTINSKKTILFFLVPISALMLWNYTNLVIADAVPFDDVEFFNKTLQEYDYPITGDMSWGNFMALISGHDMLNTSSEPVGLIDLSTARINQSLPVYLEALNGTKHLFICQKLEGFTSICNFINTSDYVNLTSLRGVSILLRK